MLLTCETYFLVQFGQFLFFVVLTSILMSVFLLMPLLCFGVMLGVFCNQVSPHWFQVVLLCATLGTAFSRTLQKGIRQWQTESQQQQETSHMPKTTPHRRSETLLLTSQKSWYEELARLKDEKHLSKEFEHKPKFKSVQTQYSYDNLGSPAADHITSLSRDMFVRHEAERMVRKAKLRAMAEIAQKAVPELSANGQVFDLPYARSSISSSLSQMHDLPYARSSISVSPVAEEESTTCTKQDARISSASDRPLLCPEVCAIHRCVAKDMTRMAIDNAYKTIEMEIAEKPTESMEHSKIQVAVEKRPLSAGRVRKRVQRVKRTWGAEDATQLDVMRGDFVNVCIDSATEQGWIYAERSSKNGKAQTGWLPTCVLKPLQSNRRWMWTARGWHTKDNTQCRVKAGVLVSVRLDSRTVEGWIYVEASEQADLRPSWLPVACLHWNDY